ncbi:cytochrome P450 2K6-like isoform X2 [Bufo bufo]|uniref:cytochrome P450 2K6-like isoform X2 n=1 Tax=Bufo bufo TaxID=8384 RepID=UPI001ABE6F73|nr:cytochrome P450 2K6-like isoform X2 [Bufo bufo]
MELISLLLSVLVILFLANVIKNQKKYKYSNFPPGPKPLPIIGNLHIISSLKPQKSFMELSKKYGTVFSVQFGTEKIVILCGYDTVKDALINHAEEFAGRPVTAIGSRTSRGNGKPFNNQIVINAAVANIIVSILMDQRFDYDDPAILKFMRLINEMVSLAGSTMVRLYNSYPWLIKWLPGAHRKIFETLKVMRAFVTETFTRKEKELDINNQRNLIDAFLAKQKEGKPESTLYYHNENLSVLVSNLFAAGMETTSTTLRWGLLLMMKYPDIQTKVQSEIENVIGSAQPQVEHRKKMPYTDAVIHEIQRYGDIVPGSVPHATTKDMTFRGYFLPKGTIVIPLLHSVLRDKAYFEKPEEFYPDHFLDSDGKFKKNEAFIPFSLGKRSCAGENLANMELFLFFTYLLQNFTFQAPPGADLDLNPAPGFTNAPLPHEICAIPRNDTYLPS